MPYTERKDMKGMTTPELVRGVDRSIADERALTESPEWPHGSVRLHIQTANFLAELLERVSPKPEPTWPEVPTR